MYTTISFVNSQPRINFESALKKTGACETLAQIVQIIREGIQSYDMQGRLISLGELEARAKAIRDGYVQKGAALPKWWGVLGKNVQAAVLKVWRFFGRVDRKELEIKRIYSEINNLVNLPLFLQLPTELKEKICSDFNESDYKSLGLVSKVFGEFAQQRLLVLKARELGYQGNSVMDAQKHLKYLFKYRVFIDLEEYAVYRGRFPFERLDWEATLRFLKTLNSERKDGVIRKILYEARYLHFCCERKNGHCYLKPKYIRGVDAFVKCIKGHSLLHDAASRQTPPIELKKILGEKGSELERVDQQGNTPLMKAIERNIYESVLLLIKAGANVNTINDAGETPLMKAIDRHWRPSLINTLLNYGAAETINHISNSGTTALYFARARNDPQIVRALLKHGAKNGIRIRIDKTFFFIQIH